jgi:hypothetical protein
MEIDENLVRADLSPAERAAHQAERKRLYEIEIEYPETGHVTERGGPPGRGRKTTDKKATVSDTVGASAKTGVTVRTGWARGRIPAQTASGTSQKLGLTAGLIENPSERPTIAGRTSLSPLTW